jgi:hypothetical protein
MLSEEELAAAAAAVGLVANGITEKKQVEKWKEEERSREEESSGVYPGCSWNTHVCVVTLVGFSHAPNLKM